MQTSSFTKKIAFAGIAMLFAVLFVCAPMVHAQAATAPATNNGGALGSVVSGLGTAAAIVNPGLLVGSTIVNATAPAVGAAATTLANGGTASQAASAAAQTALTKVTSGITGFATTALVDILQSISAMIGYLLGLVGTLFNWVIVITVFQFASYFGNSGGMLIAWGILRDLGNILLLFGFIFMGICTILDIQTFSAKKALPALLIFAVLLNFSLFAGEVIIDGANLLSASLYQQAGQSTLSTAACPNGSSSSVSACAQVGIAGQILQQSTLSSIYNQSGNTNVPPTPTNALVTYTGMIVLMGIVMVVLLAGAIMFFTRAIMLVILLILSPIGFAGMAIPPLQGMAGEWWQKLISNAFFAPIFLLLIFIGLKVMAGVQTALVGTTPNINLAAALSTPSVATGDVFILFALVIGFFVAALMFARTSGVAGAEFATKFAQRTVLAPVNAARRVAGTAGSAAGGYAFRSTAGAGAAAASRRYNSLIGGLKEKGGLIGGAAKAFDYTAGAALDGGLHGVQNIKIGSDRSYTEQKKFEKERDTETSHVAEISHLNGDLNAGIKAGNTDQIERVLQKMSVTDLENTKYVKEGSTGIKAIAKAISTDKFEKLMESKEVNAGVKEKLAEARFEEFRNAADPSKGTSSERYAANKDGVRKWANEDLVALAKYDPDTYKKLVRTTDYDDATKTGSGESILSGDQYKALKSNKSLTTNQRNELWENSKGGLIMSAIAAKNTEKIANIVKTIQSDIADLPNSALTNSSVINSYTKNQLSTIMRKNKLSPDEIKKISTAITNSSHPNYGEIKPWLDKNTPARTYWT